MRLSWNEVRVRAAAFAEEWKDAAYEKGETQSFYNDFFGVFGIRRSSVARYEARVSKLDNSSGYIDLFWPGELIVEQKSAGRDLNKAREQAGEYFDALPEHDRPRCILLSDFQTFELHDLSEREVVSFSLAELPANVEAFAFMLGLRRREFRDQDPVNIRAAELVGRLRDALHESGYRGHDLEQFLVRVVFCLFADDTGIFERDIFLDFIDDRTGKDGSDTGARLIELFQVLDTPEDERHATRDEDLLRFPFVNGSLFDRPLRIPAFDSDMREKLLGACRFNWSNISPAIFGALFQSVMDPAERRAQGAHYTTEKNILKVIEPLFMDDLRAEFERLKSRKDTRRRADLERFQEKLAQLKFLDPACGCGNFLIIAYRELRELEIEVLKEIHAKTLQRLSQLRGGSNLPSDQLSRIDVDQFYGIELGEFPARTAETALWMMDHIMNTRLSLVFGQTYARIPLENSPNIVQGDALETDWSELLPPNECSFVLGNPPFVGAKFQTPEQRAQVRGIAALGKSGGTLDYVAAWFIKAGEYVQDADARIGFVATNSITQGEQVEQLWPILFKRCTLEIAFAHRTFAWGSDARGKAHVHVVILGLDRREAARTEKRLFSYPDINSEPEESLHAALSPYLFDAGGLSDAHLVVRASNVPISGLRALRYGSQPIDGGHLIFDLEKRATLLEKEPEAKPYLRPFVGAREYLQGGSRWILALADAPPEKLALLSVVRERIAAVREYRLQSKRAVTRELAAYPTQFAFSTIPTKPFLVVPEVSSYRRDYVPIGWLEPPTIPSNLVRVLENATLADFALLTSAMHMAWLRQVGGRLKSDYRYSIGLVYNTFPTPAGFADRELDVSKLVPLAKAVLDARAAHPDATLANLYDPDLMPPQLRKAHQALDRAVDRLYRRGGFASERERVEYLFMLYEKMRNRVEVAAKANSSRRRLR
ncbi:MAG: class I SAM-dependent DNA methyltransferase [Gammaproteobacteria bacterium]|nr:class I SAM-dependent DNA methyltransferase [Gammaproteobacteria bacterium]MYD00935.1 class I SAM-dependent DNA methyltransferase [Gammaproteobacteria bacterium]MYI25029.1 class I SAM-dependent DNA methyltransferase [Gammaproteobacteria bacterium]